MVAFAQIIKNNFITSKITRFRPICSILLIGVLIRLILSLYLTHPGDFEVWYITFSDTMAGLKSPYAAMNFSYPPVWAYMLTPFASALSFFINPYDALASTNLSDQLIIATHPFFNILVRLPLIGSEIAIGLLIFDQVARSKNVQSARYAFILWFLNPLVIFISSVLGQFDVLAALMVLLSFMFFIEKKYLLCGFSLGIGILTKLYPVFLLPTYLIFLLMADSGLQKGAKILIKNIFYRYAQFLSGLLICAVIVLLPLFLSDAFSNFLKCVFTRAEYVSSLGGLSIFNISLIFPNMLAWINEYGRPQLFYTILSLFLWGSAIFIPIYYRFLIKTPDNYQRLLTCLTFTILSIYFFSVVVNPQYIIWIIPFLVLNYAMYGYYLKRTLILSVTAILFGLYWMSPFNAVILFSNFSSFGVALNIFFQYCLDIFGYPVVVISGLLGFIILVSFFFKKINFNRFKPINMGR